MGCPEGPVGENDVWKTKAGAEADVEDEHVDVVGGFDEVTVSGYKSDGFTLSKILHRKRLAKKSASEGFVHTAHLPQCEFSNLQHLPFNFLKIFFAGQSLSSVRPVVLRSLKHEDDFRRLLCFSV